MVFIDPFLGGGSVPLAALIEGFVERVVLSEIDPSVAAVWKIIFSLEAESLCSKIAAFRITRDNVIEVLASEPKNTLDLAFQTVVRNRTSRGGILATGASLVKIGENGRGVASRWYPETLVERIQLLNKFSDRVLFYERDGLELLRLHAPDPNAFIFVDPPYTAGSGKRAGSRLYDYSVLDHELIFSLLAEGRAQFMMTYDDDLDVLRMALKNGFVLQHLAMKNTHHQKLNELLITRCAA